jgi:hypothetical protein
MVNVFAIIPKGIQFDAFIVSKMDDEWKGGTMGGE